MMKQLRIIGGKWRSRVINFDPTPGLRPTTNVIRETLFNWLAPQISDAICLDLFAGSGALAFEALSRGAKHLVMIDSSYKVTQQLRKTATALAATNCDIICAVMPRDSQKIPDYAFNIVILDPPFRNQLLQPCCQLLASQPLLTSNAYIYLESEKELNLTEVLPSNWEIIRSKTAGQVAYTLVQPA